MPGTVHVLNVSSPSLPPVSSPHPCTLLHETDSNSGPQGWEQAESKATV